MLRRRPHVLGTVLAAAALAAVLASVAPARPAADDLSIRIFLARSDETQILNAKTGPNFKIVVDLDSVGGVIQTITLRTGLPDGLRWGRNAPEPDEGCTVNVSVVCTQKLTANDVGTVGGEWIWDVVADRPGSYEITASVEGEQSDPVPSNNTFTSKFEVVRPPTAGGGSVAAGAVKLTPVKPKAGSAVTATVRVTAAGTPVKPVQVTCSGRVGGAILKGTARAGSGTATCVYRPQRTAKGKTLQGKISFTAREKRFTKSFSAKLG